MVNNVTVLGHAHPRVADARRRTASQAQHQLAVQLCGGGGVQRAARRATLPDPLDTVFLVNSGSEASDLAIRLATAATGRRDVVARARGLSRLDLRHRRGVHVDRRTIPNALATRPDWVHTRRVAQQLPRQVPRCRGARAMPSEAVAADRGDDRPGPRRRGVHLRNVLRQCRWHGAAGRLPAAGVRRRCGRPAGWRSPMRCRSVTDASGTGSGASRSRTWCPISCRSPSRRATAIRSGAVITTRAIADGVPLAGLFLLVHRRQPRCRARSGSTVLDVLHDEGLQDNALRGRCAPEGPGCRRCGTSTRSSAPCTGSGLYLGVEMIRDARDAGARHRGDGRRSASACSSSA